MLIGKLIYLAHTRLNISFVVSCVSQFLHLPNEYHMEAVKQILRYLKGSPGRGVMLMKQENTSTKVFTDADWASCPNDRH